MGHSDNEIIAALERIGWRTVDGITPQARALIDEYVDNMRAVLPAIMKRRKQDLIDAYNYAVFVTGGGPNGKELTGRLFKVRFVNSGVREPIILAVLACRFWQDDAVVGDLPNPWPPLMKLLELGYPTSFDDDEKHVALAVGHKGGIEKFPIL